MTTFIQKLSLGVIALAAFVISLEMIPEKPSSTPGGGKPKEYLSVSPLPTNPLTLSFSTSKTNYSMKEKIPVEIILKGKGEPVVAVQIRINYGSNLAVEEAKAPALLPAFNYGPNKNVPPKREFQVAALLANPDKPIYLKGEVVFTKLTFQPLKTGRVTLFFGKDTGVYKSRDSTNLATIQERLVLDIIP